MKYKEIIRKNFEEWKTQGFCNEAVELNEKIGMEYFDTAQPHFFTGDLNAKVALIQLNPKRNEGAWKQECDISSFDEYWNDYTHFGEKQYGVNSSRKHKSKFDSKQILFLKPFNVLPFVENDVYHNLEVVVDQKLQMELVPFGSPNFDYKKIGVENLSPYIKNLLEVLISADRKYIIFCGRVFQELLKDFIIKEKTHSFNLEKVDGSITKQEYNIINIKLKYNNKEITACIAPQFAQQGCPIKKYGEKISSLYGIF